MEKELNKMKERKEGSISNSPWTPSTPQPLHGELKRNHLHFLDSSPNGLIHGFVCKIEDLLLVVVPSYVSKSKEFSPSSFIQQVHGYSFDPFLVYIVRGSSYEAKPSLDGECVSEGSLDLQPVAMEALRSQG